MHSEENVKKIVTKQTFYDKILNWELEADESGYCGN